LKNQKYEKTSIFARIFILMARALHFYFHRQLIFILIPAAWRQALARRPKRHSSGEQSSTHCAVTSRATTLAAGSRAASRSSAPPMTREWLLPDRTTRRSALSVRADTPRRALAAPVAKAAPYMTTPAHFSVH